MGWRRARCGLSTAEVDPVNVEKLIPWIVAGGALVVVGKVLTIGASVKGALTSVGSAIGTGLYDYLHPNELGETVFAILIFPDGQKHSVPASKISASGTFVAKNLSPQYPGDGRTYRVLVDKSDRLKRYAVPVS